MNQPPEDKFSGVHRTDSDAASAPIRMAAVVLMLVGAGLRAYQILLDRSLWLDEAALAVNIIDRSGLELLRPLAFHQAAPFGFLLMEKAAQLALGPSEIALRLIPLAASITALPIFYTLARRLLSPFASVLALSLLVILDPLIDYSAQLKQYSGDLLFASLLFLTFVDSESSGWSWPRAAAFGALGAAVVWFSYPAALLLAGIAAGTILLSLRGSPTNLLRPFLAFGLWALSFGLEYLVSLREVSANPALTGYWARAFMPFPPSSPADIDWIVRHLTQIFQDPVGLADHSGALALSVLGLFSIGSRRLLVPTALVGTVLAALAASALGRYPFEGRNLLFLVPMIVLVVSEGIEVAARAIPGRTAIVAATLVALLAYQPIRTAISQVVHPSEREDLRPAMEHLAARYLPGDSVYVYYKAEPAFRYYSYVLYFVPADVRWGIASRPQPEAYLDDIAPLLGRPRAWFVFSHDYPFGPVGSETAFILRYLDCAGTRLDDVSRADASVHLFDLSGPRGGAACIP